MIFSIVEEVFHGYDDECLLQLLVDDIDSSALDVDHDDDEDIMEEEDAPDNEDPSIVGFRAIDWHFICLLFYSSTL